MSGKRYERATQITKKTAEIIATAFAKGTDFNI